jgi:hypothetical protein
VITPHPNLFIQRLEIPEEVIVGEEFEITIKTTPGNLCWVAFGYTDSEKGWTVHELEESEASQSGLCIWKWIAPPTVAPGLMEVRVATHSELGSNMLVPFTVCVKTCRDCARKCPQSIPCDESLPVRTSKPGSTR